jgi:translocation and assembly module TamA
VRRARFAAFASTALILLALAAGPAWATEPKALVQGDMDKALRAEIQRAVGVSKTRPASRVDARRRAREAGEAAIAVLRSEGYYDYQVEPDVGDGDAPDAVIKVTTGPRSTVGVATVVWDGGAPDSATAVAALKVLALPKGAPARAADVVGAEGRVAAILHSRGYADAAIHTRKVVVDHASHTLQPTFHFVVHDLVRLDGLQITEKGHTRIAFIQRLAPWKKGDVYDPTKVAELERRLRDSGVFDAVTIALAPVEQSVDGLRPVVVSLEDRKPHTLELGGGYSTSEGVGVDGKWILYNVLGRADTLTFTGRLAQIQQKADIELDQPDFWRADQVLKVGGDIFADATTAYDDDGIGVRANLERAWNLGDRDLPVYALTNYITYGATIDVVSTREKTAVNANGIAVGEDLKLAIFAVQGGFAIDRSDDPLNPTRGWRLQGEAVPTFVTGDRTLPYLKLDAQASGYLPLGADAATVLALRVKLGSILGGDIPSVPADRRFFAGGGGSVRGFSYQGVGPQLSDRTPVGGDSLFESSFEVRHHITGPWGVVGFIDAGSLGPTAIPNFNDLSVGAGVGVRYDLGFAPLRVDIATPITRRKGDPWVQLYLSIGQSF